MKTREQPWVAGGDQAGRTFDRENNLSGEAEQARLRAGADAGTPAAAAQGNSRQHRTDGRSG